MAGPYSDDPNALGRGLFANLVGAAQEHLSTADVWAALRQGAQDWANHVLSTTLGRAPTSDELATAVKQATRSFTIQDMNRWRHEAGLYVRAQTALSQTAPGEQIYGDAIFERNRALWGGQAGATPRYRVRVEVHFRGGGAEGTEWNYYDLTGPISTREDIEAQVRAGFTRLPYNSNATLLGIGRYFLEAI